MSAAWESLHRATLELITGDTLKQRLIHAYSYHLKDMDVAQLPSDLRVRFLELLSRITRVTPLRGDTAINATVRKMSNEEAGECAQQILEIFTAVCDLRDLAQRPPPAAAIPLRRRSLSINPA